MEVIEVEPETDSQDEQEPHSLGDDSGPAPNGEESRPKGRLIQEYFYCFHCGDDLTDLVEHFLEEGYVIWDVFRYCPTCGVAISKPLEWAVKRLEE